MAARAQIPADVAAALDAVPEARDRFASLPSERQSEWIAWVDRGGGGRGRSQRIDEMVRRLLSPEATVEEEVIDEPAGAPFGRYWWVWLLVLLLLVLGGLLAWFLLSRDDKATAPNVIGLTASAAAQRIQDEGLEAVPQTGQSDRPSGIVFAQRPGAGTQLDEGQDVTIFISSGKLVVPDVVSQPVEDATDELEQQGLKVTVQRVASSHPKGIVLEQNPAAGVTAVHGATVTLTASSGQKPVVVPSVVGKTQGEAVNTLTGLGLQPDLRNVSSAKPAGVVVAQKPPASTEVDKGSKVTLNVSTGTPGATTTGETTTSSGGGSAAGPNVRVPEVVGLTQTPALRRLNVQELRPTVVYVQSDKPANQVVAQSPAAGVSRARGSKVTVRVSTGPNPEAAVDVPDVVGQEQPDAAATLRDAGFRVVVLNRPTDDASQDGVVVDAQPGGGSSIPGGSQVTIFVGRSR